MSYRKNDVSRIVGEYALALREKRLCFSAPQRSTLEEVLLAELCGEGAKGESKNSEHKELYGVALQKAVGRPSLSITIAAHAHELYGKNRGLERYSEDNLLKLYQQAIRGICMYNRYKFSKVRAGIPMRVPISLQSLCMLECYFMERGMITEKPFYELQQWRRQVSTNRELQEPAAVVKSVKKSAGTTTQDVVIKDFVKDGKKRNNSKQKDSEEEEKDDKSFDKVNKEWGWLAPK